jgi:hypothetical protein
MYGDYTEKEVTKITMEENFNEKYFNINDCETTYFDVRYTIESMEDLKNNHFYKVIFNITKNKMSLDIIDKNVEGNFDNFTVFKNSIYNLYAKEDFCIDSNGANLKAAS